MATLTIDGTENAAIAADPARTYLEFSLRSNTAPVKWCFGATFVDSTSQELVASLPRIFEGVPAQQAVSFQMQTVAAFVDTTVLP